MAGHLAWLAVLLKFKFMQKLVFRIKGEVCADPSDNESN